MNKKICSLLLMGIACTLLQAQNSDDITTKYHQTNNSVEKRELLKQLNSSTAKTAIKVPDTTINVNQALLSEALTDKSFTVVEEAIIQIGKQNLTVFDPDLYSIYLEADKRFMGYSERIINAVISAAGQLNTPMLKKVLLNELDLDNGSSRSKLILDAVKQTNDKSLIENVNSYINRIEPLVKYSKEKKYDPILYSGKMRSIEYAKEVVLALSSENGGN